MLVPIKGTPPAGPMARYGSTGYITPAQLGLDGTASFGEGQTYEGPLIDATGYNNVFLILAMAGVVMPTAVDVECHYIDPFLAANPAPFFTATMPYAGFMFNDPNPVGFTWGTQGTGLYNPTGSVGFKDNSFFHVDFHMSFVTVPNVVTPMGWAFFGTSPEVPASA